MPLSDEERRRLEELERELIEDDPELARELEAEPPVNRSAGRTAVLSILVLAAGLVLVIVGIAAKAIVIGVIGFLLMGTGTYHFMSNGTHGNSTG